jgi:hypothetical protein
MTSLSERSLLACEGKGLTYETRLRAASVALWRNLRAGHAALLGNLIASSPGPERDQIIHFLREANARAIDLQ